MSERIGYILKDAVRELATTNLYEAMKQNIPLSSGSITQESEYSIVINISDSTSLVAQDDITENQVPVLPKYKTKINAYNKKTDTGTIRVSAHTRKSKPTLKQRFKILKSAIGRDKAPLKRPEINIFDAVKQSVRDAIYRLGQ